MPAVVRQENRETFATGSLIAIILALAILGATIALSVLDCADVPPYLVMELLWQLVLASWMLAVYGQTPQWEELYLPVPTATDI